jgi:hypothetical protein
MIEGIDEIGSFDELVNGTSEKPQGDESDSLEAKLERERIQWKKKIENMALKVKKLDTLTELMTEAYSERQRVVEYHHYILSLLVRINKQWRREYSLKHDHYSYKSQKRFPNETTKNNQIYADLHEIVTKKELLDTHAKYMNETKNTIDNIIFGIKYRVDIENIKNGR